MPDSTKGFYLQVNINAISVINDLSIYTDANAFNSASINCVTDTSDAIEKTIICRNIGKLESDKTKYLRFAFVANGRDYDSFKFS